MPEDSASRPIVLYVSGVSHADIPHRPPSTTVLDIEISREDVWRLIGVISDRMEEGIPGTIRVRFLGHMVIS